MSIYDAYRYAEHLRGLPERFAETLRPAMVRSGVARRGQMLTELMLCDVQDRTVDRADRS